MNRHTGKIVHQTFFPRCWVRTQGLMHANHVPCPPELHLQTRPCWVLTASHTNTSYGSSTLAQWLLGEKHKKPLEKNEKLPTTVTQTPHSSAWEAKAGHCQELKARLGDRMRPGLEGDPASNYHNCSNFWKAHFKCKFFEVIIFGVTATENLSSRFIF